MTPPEAPVTGNTPEVTSGPPAVFACPGPRAGTSTCRQKAPDQVRGGTGPR